MPPRRTRKSEHTTVETETAAAPETPSTTPRRGRRSIKIEAGEAAAKEIVPPPKSTRKKIKQKIEFDEEEDAEEQNPSVKAEVVKEEAESKPKKSPAKRKAKIEDEDADDTKVKKKRKTKEEKEAEAMPLAERTAISTLNKAMYFGAHVSAAGGVQNAINNSLHIGGNSFALFLKSQRKWTNPPLAPLARDEFKAFCVEHNYSAAKHVLPHGSYLINLAQPDPEKAEQAYTCFLDDLRRCEELGITLYNFHPGSTLKFPRPEAIGRIAVQLNKAHKATKTVTTVLENMAGAGNVIGSTWEDLRDIIALVEDKDRVGVCIDTCHTFAAGYDLRTPEAFQKTMEGFDSTVGMSYLKALHLNDSKAPLGANRDRHANIGTGFLGLRAFWNVVNFEPFQGLPMVLETPIDKKGKDGKTVEDKEVWATEIKLLESLIGVDTETEEFKKEELRLQVLGEGEREKFQGQVDKKKQKTLDSMFKKASPKKKKRAKDESNEEEGDESEGGCSH